MNILGYVISPMELVGCGILLLVFVSISFAAIWDAWGREFPSPMEKVAWVQLAVLFPFVGGIGYFIFGKKRGRKTS